uniref:Uncharacterized protein n=1 Tax=viral metagenome TaxID=1070528 RepID=A0A6C0EWW2_9ZZZZ
MEESAVPAAVAAAVAAVPTGWQRVRPPQPLPPNTPPYSINLINIRDPITHEILAEIRRIVGQPEDIKCKTHEVNADDASGESAFEQGLLSDDVPSSQGTNIGRDTTSFAVISYIRLMFISPYNSRGGNFDRIKIMMHHLFFDRGLDGFVGLTRTGVLSEYTATIYYAVSNPFAQYDDIIKIMIYFMRNNFRGGLHNGIHYAFKLDRGIKPGDTIKIILSLKFGDDNGANVILIPILNIVTLNRNQVQGAHNVQNYMSIYCAPSPPYPQCNELYALSIYDLIARIRLYANQEAFGALIEPTDVEKALMVCFFHDKSRDELVDFIQFIKFLFYDHASQYKNFAFFLNIFFNFYKVSMNLPEGLNSRSTAKIMYTTFFSTNNNYGSIIRIFINMMSNPLFNEHTIMFLSGSNAARAYSLTEAMLVALEQNPGQDRATLAPLYDSHMANQSDNDFMFYLKNEEGEQHRMAIRMMLGACLYYLKYILTPAEYSMYTDLLEQSISIVGHDDHLLAQRLNAVRAFLEGCFNMTPLFGTTILAILGDCNFLDFNFYDLLSGNVTLAFLDVVLKHNTAKEWYIAVFTIFDVPNPTPDVLRETNGFLIDHAMAINCIATPWTLILNILYTIFVTENCIARIVVGKLGNDPKNLKKYFSILNTHLNYLIIQYTTPRNEVMLAHIEELIGLQGQIIIQSELCQQPESIDPPIGDRYTELKTRCGRWVRKMFLLASNVSTRELFFLSVNYPFTPPRRSSTPIEKGICYAWSVDGNICIKEDFLARFDTTTITPANFQPVFTVGSVSEQTMHNIVPRIQSLITETKDTAEGIPITPNPNHLLNPPPPPPPEIPSPFPLTVTQSQYTYMNWLWKHLTNTSIDLRAHFKGIVKDAKRIVGSKNFTAISLFGAYPCGLLIDELVESDNTYDTLDQMNALKNSSGIIECRRGLLPLLVPEHPQYNTLFARMVVHLLTLDIRINMVIECCKEIRAGFALGSIDINGIMSQMYNAALQAVLTLDLNTRLDVIVASIIDACNTVVIPVAGHIPEAAAQNIRQNVINRCSENIYSTNNILLFLGFLFSIKIKSNASIGPRNMLSLVDSIINFYDLPSRNSLLPTFAYDPLTSCSLTKFSNDPDNAACAFGGEAQDAGSGHSKKSKLPSVPKSSQAASALPLVPKSSRGISKKSIKEKSDPLLLLESDERPQPVNVVKKRKKKVIEMEPLAPLAPIVEEKPMSIKTPAIQQKAKTIRSSLQQLINPQSGPFNHFMSKILVITKEIGIIFNPKTCVSGITRQNVFNTDKRYTDDPTYSHVRLLVGGGDNTRNNKTKSNHKISKTNHTRKNKYKNNNKCKKNKNKAKHNTIVTFYQSKSQCNKNKYKSKIIQRNVTFKRRRNNNK